MQRQSSSSFIAPVLCILLITGFRLHAQDTAVVRTPEEQRELFGYCEKYTLMKQFNISSETADKIGQINYWVTVTKLSVAANTSDTFATPKEVETAALKKYKAIGLSGEQAKQLLEASASPEPCAAITLTYSHFYDTLSTPHIIQLYKPYKKAIVDKTGINGRQADMLFEVEAWKQKEALSIAAIPITDFNRIRRTVALYAERERRYRVIGLSDQQIEGAIEFFNQHQLGTIIK